MNIILNSLWTVKRSFTKVRLVNNKNYYIYKKMREVSQKTFHKFNPDCKFVNLEFQNPFDNHQLAFYETFKTTYKLWKEEKCNIIFHDLDSICHEDLSEIFENINDFMCFGVHCNKEIENLSPDREHNFSCSLRYFPKTMSEECWQLGFDLWKKYFDEGCIGPWGIEQKIYNDMVYLNENYTEYKDYFNINDVTSFLRGLYDEDCMVYQFHGSRNPEYTLNRLEKYSRWILEG